MVRRLIGRSGRVPAHNTAPGVVERRARRRHAARSGPAPGRGQHLGPGSGPRRDRKTGMLVQAESGMVSVTGGPGHPVPEPRVPSADAITAGLYSAKRRRSAPYRAEERSNEARPWTCVHVRRRRQWMGHPLYMQLYGGTGRT
ncbi:hypothetical protein HBB16_10820 [Pseudonocardia sp. MCCB 268]|nr:hypothetical protein [Pseudonocardia cytotoxica]